MPPGVDPDGWNRVDAQPLKDLDVERIPASVTSEAPLGQHAEHDLRISIAGAQEKTALLRMGGKCYRPIGATPTTHILKLPLGLVGNMRADMTDSVENEWLCSQLMNGLGIATAATQIGMFGETKTLVVRRFDRRWARGARGERAQGTLQAVARHLDRAYAAGGPLPGAGHRTRPEVRKRWRSIDARLPGRACEQRAR